MDDLHNAANELPFLQETTKIVASHVANNPISADELPGLIREVYATFLNLQGGAPPSGAASASASAEEPVKATPAVPAHKSVYPDYIVCLEDGKHLKMLKRHLMTSYGMTPEDYRIKWGLPGNYPMVAPNYAETRSELAKKSGLGHSRGPSRKVHTRAEATRKMQARADAKRMQAAEDEVVQPTEPERRGAEVRRIPEGMSGAKRGRYRHAAA